MLAAMTLELAVGIVLPGLCSGASLLLLSHFQVILKSSPALAPQMMPWTLTTASRCHLAGRQVARLKAGTVMSKGFLIMGIGALDGWSFVRPGMPFVRVAVPLTLFGAWRLATMTPRTSVINAAPATASGSASAVNSATVRVASTLANPLAMSLEQTQEVTAVWREAVNQSIAADSSVIPEHPPEQLTAGPVWFGLKGQEKLNASFRRRDTQGFMLMNPSDGGSR
jgi:hypothetical protein